MPTCRSARLLGLAAASAIALGPTLAAAQDYPARSVEFIVPFNPGGGADASQRTFNKYAEPIVGQSLVIVNKPGAGALWAGLRWSARIPMATRSPSSRRPST